MGSGIHRLQARDRHRPRLHDELEYDVAALMGAESALVFSSGYLANLGVLTALSDPGTLLLVDAHAHASLFDAARLSRGDLIVMPHNDVEQVRRASERAVATPMPSS